jgi:hypothetical protein
MVGRFAVPSLLILALASVAAGAGARVPARAGLWLGPLPVCSETVDHVALVDDHGWPSLLVTFKPEWRLRLERETTARLRHHMPIRLDGRIVLAPNVYEPITGGIIRLNGSSRAETEALQRAAARPCGAAELRAR